MWDKYYRYVQKKYEINLRLRYQDLFNTMSVLLSSNVIENFSKNI